MVEGITNSGIKYDSYITGPQGARFELFVTPNHTIVDIASAKHQLKNEQDVVKIYIIKVSQEESDKLLLFLHPIASVNRKLNEEALVHHVKKLSN